MLSKTLINIIKKRNFLPNHAYKMNKSKSKTFFCVRYFCLFVQNSCNTYNSHSEPSHTKHIENTDNNIANFSK